MRQRMTRSQRAVRSIAGIFAALALLSGPVGRSTVAHAASASTPATIFVCHGYGCSFRSKLVLGPGDAAQFQSIMRAGASSPAAERAALKKAVQYFEERSYQIIGIRDRPKAAVVG